MKSHMINHVENARHTMFRRSTDSVKEQLKALCKRVENDMAVQVQEIYNLLARDYLSVLVGVDSSIQPAGLPRAERLLRAEMYPILQGTSRWFAKSPAAEVSSVSEGVDPFADDDDLAASQLQGEFQAGSHEACVKTEAV